MKNSIIIAGVDEVGRGCLAGPVVSAAVILNEKIELKLIKDSKKINFENRLKIAEYIDLKRKLLKKTLMIKKHLPKEL